MIRQVAATPAETADRVHAALQAKAISDVDVGATLVVAQCAPTLRAPTRGALIGANFIILRPRIDCDSRVG
jgi:hypothetical protein